MTTNFLSIATVSFQFQNFYAIALDNGNFKFCDVTLTYFEMIYLSKQTVIYC